LKRTSRSRWLVEGLSIVLVALVFAFLLRTYVVQTFYIPSGSMTPTLQIGDRILVNKLSYRFHSVHEGDIVVFSHPPLEHCGTKIEDLVKRVIATPGQTISLAHGQVFINNKLLPEPWLPNSPNSVTLPGPDPQEPFSLTRPYKVPANNYFMMGDNRTGSCDSRWWGPVPKSLIIGKVDARIWPLSRFKIF
jgi:signal peptidase I